ncbi:hypothetical protein ADL15_04200 [Actinoplanes awajinensis subsp. mycoplanecinus]|uniref:Uncharacterized protein n=1 Tax=Actinoplanes awajinensis subsp. mycoplanecinus TaxID=135947 RepID=A0A0X3V9K4_9ACTN|nr:hypothetical protein ADL15_04200 [Actinoplanes awajinensis subsp. mycoplanecinus]
MQRLLEILVEFRQVISIDSGEKLPLDSSPLDDDWSFGIERVAHADNNMAILFEEIPYDDGDLHVGMAETAAIVTTRECDQDTPDNGYADDHPQVPVGLLLGRIREEGGEKAGDAR